MTTPDMSTLDGMVAALAAIGCEPRRHGGGWILRCPHPDHADDSPSATLAAGRTAPWVLNCFACAPSKGARRAWLAAVRARVKAGTPLPPAAPSARRSGGNSGGYGVPVAAYDYVNDVGQLVARKIRYESAEGAKSFGWARPHGSAMATGLRGMPLHELPLFGLASLTAVGQPVYVVEGEKDATRLHGMGLPAVSGAGGANADPYACTLPGDLSPLEGRDVIVVGDRDSAGTGLALAWQAALEGVAASVRLARAAIDSPGADVSDHLDAGLPLAGLDYGPEPSTPTPATVTLTAARTVFLRWFGQTYDIDALHMCLAVVAVERLNGDPLWGLIVSGSGHAKTETVAACAHGAVMASTIQSEGALLSATAKKERAEDASGGLLRQLEPRGVLIIKDVTSILSMDHTARGSVLSALREVHDGSWDRNVGTDGGRTLTWTGRIAVLGAVTTAWDRSHSVIAAMGDRFVLLRMDSRVHRPEAGRQAIRNTGAEEEMRAELRAAASGVIAGMNANVGPVTEDEQEAVLAAADLVTRARTGVDYNYRGDVIDAHAPEMPTRFAKELAQVLRGGVAIGMDRRDALRLAIRCARDSMPPIRLAIIDDLAANAGSAGCTAGEVRKRIDKPNTTVRRELEALHMLGVTTVIHEEDVSYGGHVGGTRWYYGLAGWVNPEALRLPDAPDPYPPAPAFPSDPRNDEKENPRHDTYQ